MINICFHGIGAPNRVLEPGEDDYWISLDQYLTTLDELTTWGDVAISFDDGNDSDAALGLAPLVERNLTASFFVVAGRIGEPGSLGPDEVRRLRDQGMTIGSHGMAHRPWPGLDAAELSVELDDARSVLEELLDKPIAEAALPLGRYDRRVLKELRLRGYRRVFSSDRSPARRDAWLQPRYSVTRHDTVKTLRERVRDRQGFRHKVRGELNSYRKRVR